MNLRYEIFNTIYMCISIERKVDQLLKAFHGGLKGYAKEETILRIAPAGDKMSLEGSKALGRKCLAQQAMKVLMLF